MGELPLFSPLHMRENVIHHHYYLKDNSARSYVAALKYADRLVRLRKGYGEKTLYGDFFSTHLDQNVLGALRADLGIEFEVTPPYMHWLNGYAEAYMRVMKIATRVRLLQMVGKYLDDVRITDMLSMAAAVHCGSVCAIWGRLGPERAHDAVHAPSPERGSCRRRPVCLVIERVPPRPAWRVTPCMARALRRNVEGRSVADVESPGRVRGREVISSSSEESELGREGR